MNANKAHPINSLSNVDNIKVLHVPVGAGQSDRKAI